MSEDEEKGFLARWSQRKREAVQPDPKPLAPEKPAQPSEAATDKTTGETEPPFDLESLPKLDELTANTDMTVFFKKGVPESIRNAALRKSWALDPAIRNYVNPALDYAYDWNTPGGVPGSGELAPGTDIARMVLQIMGNGAPSPAEAVDKRDQTETFRRDDPLDHVAEHQAGASAPVPSVRLSETPPPVSATCTEVAGPEQPVVGRATTDWSQAEPRAFASQQETRRHGTARPK
jgi:hypothetical protein